MESRLTLVEPASGEARAKGPPLLCGARGEVAQLVEHTTENRGVAGSIPALAIQAAPALGDSTADHPGSPVGGGCSGGQQVPQRPRQLGEPELPSLLAQPPGDDVAPVQREFRVRTEQKGRGEPDH